MNNHCAQDNGRLSIEKILCIYYITGANIQFLLSRDTILQYCWSIKLFMYNHTIDRYFGQKNLRTCVHSKLIHNFARHNHYTSPPVWLLLFPHFTYTCITRTLCTPCFMYIPIVRVILYVANTVGSTSHASICLESIGYV